MKKSVFIVMTDIIIVEYSQKQHVGFMKFELLPKNEILLEYFKCLNTVDLFRSFDQLNYRFNNLIQHILLYLKFSGC
jgi:hypothetical protein